MSENSSSSLKEIRYFKGEDGGCGGSGQVCGEQERLVLVTAEKRVPFAVYSVIPFHKSAAAKVHRYEARNELFA